MKHVKFGNELYPITIACKELDIKPIYSQLEIGFKIKFSGFSIEDFLYQVLEEYGAEKIAEKINDLLTENEELELGKLVFQNEKPASDSNQINDYNPDDDLPF